MSLLGFRSRCTPMLQCARQWILKRRDSFIELASDIGKAASFATYFTDSSLFKKWKKHFPYIPVFTHTTGSVDLPLMTIQAGGQIQAVAFSSDSTGIVSGCDDNSVRVWDASTGTEQKVFEGHTDPVLSVAFSSDGTKIVSGSVDNSLRVWDASTGIEQKALKGHIDSVNSVAFSSDGS